MRRQHVLAVLALMALLAAAPSWNDTTCDRTTPLPTGWAESSTAENITGAGVARGVVGVPLPGMLPLGLQ
jgi:hypothetical protein